MFKSLLFSARQQMAANRFRNSFSDFTKTSYGQQCGNTRRRETARLNLLGRYGAACIDNLIRAPDGTALSPDVLMFNWGLHNSLAGPFCSI